MTSGTSMLRRVSMRFGRGLRTLRALRPLGVKALRRHELMERLLEVQQGLVRDCRFEKRDLSRLDLNGMIAERVVFVGCRLRGTNLDRSELRDLRLVDCDCRGVTAVGAKWTDVTIEGCNLSGADLTDISLSGSCTGIELESSILTRAKLDAVNLYAALLRGADLRDASLVEAVLEEADCSCSNFFNVSCNRALAAGAVFRNAVCVGADFRGADLTGASFEDSQARVADFRSALLDGASFRRADLGESSFTSAAVCGADFEGARTWNASGLEAAGDRSAR